MLVHQDASESGYRSGVLALTQAVGDLMTKQRRLILQGFAR